MEKDKNKIHYGKLLFFVFAVIFALAVLVLIVPFVKDIVSLIITILAYGFGIVVIILIYNYLYKDQSPFIMAQPNEMPYTPYTESITAGVGLE